MKILDNKKALSNLGGIKGFRVVITWDNEQDEYTI